jgi:hypothetical protein
LSNGAVCGGGGARRISFREPIGKTLTLTYLLFKKWFVNSQRIYANYHLYKIPYMFVGSVATFNSIREGCFGGDEFWLSCDSRSHKWAKVIIANILARSRKRNLTIYYTTQLLSSVDPRVRKITDFVAYPMLNTSETICKLIIFRGGKLTPANYMRTIYFETKPVFSMFDTNEEVIPWPEKETESTYPEDGKWIFQESQFSDMLIFDSWQEADKYAREFWKGKRVIV